MNDFILKQEEQLETLNKKLDDIERLLIGSKCCEEKIEYQKECLLDVIKNNNEKINEALNTLERIAVILKGEQ